MASTTRHEAAEQAMRELLPSAGLPPPDDVEYEEASVVMLWYETKLAVVIDLEDGPGLGSGPGPGSAGEAAGDAPPQPASSRREGGRF
jgi:hypothetical protein